MTVPPIGPRDPRQAWRANWYRTLVIFSDHFPLLAGAVVTAVVHGLRDLIVTTPAKPWLQVIDQALFIAQYTMLFGLVLPNLITLLTELAERSIVGVYRVRHTWKTGERLPRPDTDAE